MITAKRFRELVTPLDQYETTRRYMRYDMFRLRRHKAERKRKVKIELIPFKALSIEVRTELCSASYTPIQCTVGLANPF